MKKIFTTLWLLFSLHSISQTVHYVNDNAIGANNGTSWANAFSKLQDALAKAVSGDQVWVAEGIYYPDEGVGYNNNNRSHSFRLKNGVAIYGGFAGAETNLVERKWNTHLTTLSGDIDQDGKKENNSYHVVQGNNVDNTAALDGFTITGGYCEESNGGGIYNVASSPTIKNCNISGNTTRKIVLNGVVVAGDGGGVYNLNSYPSFTDCSFSANGAKHNGGGMYNYGSSPVLINCFFSSNNADESGGGMYNHGSSPVIINCKFSGNSGDIGAGIYNNYSSSPNLTNCILSGNIASFLAGAVANYSSSPIFTNCSFTKNSATGFVNPDDPADPGTGGIFNAYASSSPILTNCILWENSGIQIYNAEKSNPVVTYSIVQGGYAGTGNLDLDPLFVDASNGDLRLKAGSPAIDAGLTSANTTSLDLEGKPRVLNGIIDMGAYEYQVAPMVITSVAANPSTLWPPNHKMKEVKVSTVTTGGSGNTQCHITAVSSNEPQSSKKKGHSSTDWQITGPDKVLLRAERNGNGNGRIYTITVTCSDAAGSSKSKTVQVKVPHDQGHNFITSNAQSNQGETIQVEANGSLKAVPNPFSSQARISFSVPKSGYTTLDVIDATGVRVERLYATQAEAGKVYTLSFGNNKLKSGMYLLRLTTGKHVQTYRLMLMQ